ncbi:MAG TPA: efflux RND transporter periplasmic adaptor subunit [Candidatus Eisenbacteria bacterium]|nr:efflux RND transporter periplasmic adaptor subunit [Candidatus Eisenbacteria bacterium]
MLSAVLVVIVGVGLVKYFQIQAAIAGGKSWAPPPEAVTTVVASQETWPATLEAIGSVSAVHGVLLAADLPGVVRAIHFQSGQHVSQGAVLVELDTRQEVAQLHAAEAQRDLDKINLDRAQKLLARQVISQTELDQADANYKQAEANVATVQATIDRKKIRAPFSGVAGIRQVNLGQYLAGGDPVVQLQSMDPMYVDFSVPQEEAGALPLGSKVHVTADSTGIVPDGKVTAVNSIVDPSTRNLLIQATFPNPHARLRPGMFVDVQVFRGKGGNVISVPASAINYAPYGNSVFIVNSTKGPNGAERDTVQQQFVTVGNSRGDQVAILTGLKPGQQIVSSGVFKLRTGATVKVNNSVQPGNNPSPKPQDS